MAETRPKAGRNAARSILLLGLGVIASLPVLYVLLAVALAAVPVNSDRGDRSPPRGGITVFVLSNGVHADIIVPRRVGGRDWWRLLAGHPWALRPHQIRFVAFGWGDRGFYLETPTWGDLTVVNAARALLWPSPTVMHVSTYAHAPGPHPHLRTLVLEPAGYERLAAFIEASFVLADGAPRPVAPGYGPNDAFFEARGRYHLFNTCNNWAGRALERAGVRVGLWTPLDFNLRYHLPAR